MTYLLQTAMRSGTKSNDSELKSNIRRLSSGEKENSSENGFEHLHVNHAKSLQNNKYCSLKISFSVPSYRTEGQGRTGHVPKRAEAPAT